MQLLTTNNQVHANREAYLEQAVLECRPLFDHYASPLPQKIRVSCGFPSNAKRTGAIGECHSDRASGDNAFEIFVSPVLDNPVAVFEVLIHELCHTLAGGFNHNRGFQKHADALGLIPLGSGTNAYKATKGGASFMGMWQAIIESLGDYPHKVLNLSQRKTQGTRMLKAVCPTCNYSIRTTNAWAIKGLPVCSIDGDTFVLA
jgi:hypothetical protein